MTTSPADAICENCTAFYSEGTEDAVRDAAEAHAADTGHWTRLTLNWSQDA